MTANTGSVANTGANAGSWLSAHGKLWYDDPLYRVAWILWPQALGLLLFVVLWLGPPSSQRIEIPRAKPVVAPPTSPPPAQQVPFNPPATPPLAQQPGDPVAPCKTADSGQIIQTRTPELGSGNLQ